MALMKKHQMGITEFAEKCGMEEGRMERILHSRGRLTPAEAVQIAAAFGRRWKKRLISNPFQWTKSVKWKIRSFIRW